MLFRSPQNPKTPQVVYPDLNMTRSIVKLVQDFQSSSVESHVVLLVQMILLEQFVDSAIEEVDSDAVQIPRSPRPQPEEVPRHGIGESHNGCDRFHHVPRESNVRAILRKEELEANHCREREAISLGCQVGFLFAVGKISLDWVESGIQALKLVDESLVFDV